MGKLSDEMSSVLRCAAGLACLAQVVAFASVSPSFAEDKDTALSEHPFAEHRLVLQLSDDDGKKQRLVLSVANNLLKFYDPDKIAIEVVAYGPGIALLLVDSPNRSAVDSLVVQGVRFDICMNTVETIERDSGKPLQINPKAHRVEAGVAQILTLTEKGYTLVRP